MGPIDEIPAHEYWQSIRPMTLEEAKSFLQRDWDSRYSPLKYSECEALCKFVVESRRVLTAYSAEHYIRPFSQLSAVMAELSCMRQGPETLEALRKRQDRQNVRRNQLEDAAELLEQAARLIGVRPSLFYSFDSPEERDERARVFVQQATLQGVPHDRIVEMLANRREMISKEPPAIVGETAAEHEARRELNRVLTGLSPNRDETIALSYLQRHDNTDGAGARALRPKSDVLAFRMLWDVWPHELKKTIKGVWHPNIVASEILKFCGHEINSKQVGTYISRIKTDKSELTRLDTSTGKNKKV